MRRSSLAVLALSVILGFSVFASDDTHHGEEGDHGPKWKLVKAQKPAKSSELPSELIEEIKESFHGKHLEKKFISLEMYFFDKHHAIDPPIKIVTPVGGGSLGLEGLLPSGRAKFYYRIVLMDEHSEPLVPDKVYFVPRISLKEDGKEKNCGKYFDITRYYKEKISSEEGAESYVSEGLYSTLLLGSFVFVKVVESKVYLGNLNLSDTRFLNQRCPKEELKE